jgi:hypothetical protein
MSAGKRGSARPKSRAEANPGKMSDVDMDIEARFIEQECEGGCQLATIRAENALLRAALLWMRNHCDVGKPELRELALARADAVLKDYEPSLAGRAYFRARYPVLETQPLTAAPASMIPGK